MIYYERPDVEGPKLCSYKKVSINADTTSSLHELLLTALGPKNDVKKVRHLFLVGQTRIHVDSVDGLGNFLELEVIIKIRERYQRLLKAVFYVFTYRLF